MDFFLKGKHWQVFLALFGLPMLGILVFMVWMVAYADSGTGAKELPVVLAATIVTALILFAGWFFTLVSSLHSKLPKAVKMNFTLFKVFLTVPILFMLRLTATLYKTVQTVLASGNPDPAALAFSDPLLIPLFLLAMFCMFYCLLFAAKTFKSVELKREVDLPDYIAELLQLWYFPLGVWLLQPRINRIFSKA